MHRRPSRRKQPSAQQPLRQPGNMPNGLPPQGIPPGHAPQGHGVAPTGGIAIIDLPFILKNHGGFNQRLEELRHEAEAVENEFKAKRDAIQKLVVSMDDYQRGSPEFKKLEEDITKRQANLSVEINIAKKKFQETEARIYYEVYQQIVSEVRYYSEANRINLVLKFNGEEANKDNPEEIMREMQKMILYYNQAVDITPLILDRMKGQPQRPGGSNPTANRQPAGVPPRTAPR